MTKQVPLPTKLSNAMSSWQTRFCLGVIVFGCAALVVAQLLEVQGWSAPTKLAASTGFVLLALAVGAWQSVYGKTVLAALALSWIGDAFLLGSSNAHFIAGLSAFLLAHLCYCAAFSRLGVDRRRAGFLALPIYATTIAVLYWLSPAIPEDMQIAVWVYGFVISTMLTLAVGTSTNGWLVPFGAALFFVSDLAVAMSQFLDTSFPHWSWGLPLYYAGQTLLSLSTQRTASA